MRKAVLSLFVVAAILAVTFMMTTSSSSLRVKSIHPMLGAFNEWQLTHSKVYLDESEMMMRFGVWLAKDHEIEEFNARKFNWTKGHNQFSDMTQKEFRDQVLTTITPAVEFTPQHVIDADLEEHVTASSYNWVDKLLPVKNQGGCGSCWAFSAVSTLEAAYTIKFGVKMDFSEQEMVDCDPNSAGCGGGNPYWCFYQWAARGAATQQCYGYQGKNGACRRDCPISGPLMKGLVYTCTEGQITSAVKKQVVSVGVAADDIMSYSSGRITSGCDGPLNHAVNVVAYDDNEYIVRNSWGVGWGEEGYFRVETGTNRCQIGAFVTYAKI